MKVVVGLGEGDLSLLRLIEDYGLVRAAKFHRDWEEFRSDCVEILDITPLRARGARKDDAIHRHTQPA